jgi:hypothetical protein
MPNNQSIRMPTDRRTFASSLATCPVKCRGDEAATCNSAPGDSHPPQPLALEPHQTRRDQHGNTRHKRNSSLAVRPPELADVRLNSQLKIRLRAFA